MKDWMVYVIAGVVGIIFVCFSALVLASSGPSYARVDKCSLAKDKVFEAVDDYFQFQEDLDLAVNEAVAFNYDEIRMIRMKADWLEKARTIERNLEEAWEKAKEVCE